MSKSSFNMPPIKIKVHNPTSPAYSKRISKDTWQLHEEAIRNMHSQRMPRNQILDVLKSKYHFSPSESQLDAQFALWHLRVYNKRASSSRREVASTEDDSNPSRTNSQVQTPDDLRLARDVPETLSRKCKDIFKGFLSVPYKPWLDWYWPFARDLAQDYFAVGNLQIIEAKRTADFLCATRSYEDAFDLYYAVCYRLILSRTMPDPDVFEAIIGCVRSCRSREQLDFVNPLIKAATQWTSYQSPEMALFSKILRSYCIYGNYAGLPQRDCYVDIAPGSRGAPTPDIFWHYIPVPIAYRERLSLKIRSEYLTKIRSNDTTNSPVSFKGSGSEHFLTKQIISNLLDSSQRLIENYDSTLINAAHRMDSPHVTGEEYGALLYSLLYRSWRDGDFTLRTAKFEKSARSYDVSLGGITPADDADSICVPRCELLMALTLVITGQDRNDTGERFQNEFSADNMLHLFVENIKRLRNDPHSAWKKINLSFRDVLVPPNSTEGLPIHRSAAKWLRKWLANDIPYFRSFQIDLESSGSQNSPMPLQVGVVEVTRRRSSVPSKHSSGRCTYCESLYLYEPRSSQSSRRSMTSLTYRIKSNGKPAAPSYRSTHSSDGAMSIDTSGSCGFTKVTGMPHRPPVEAIYHESRATSGYSARTASQSEGKRPSRYI